MRKFVFRFEAILKYRCHRRDLARQVFAQALAAGRELAARRADLEAAHRDALDELRAGGRQGPINIDRLAARRYFAGRVAGELQLLQRHEELVAQQIALCRQMLLRADRDVKVLEKLAEKQQARFRHEQERREALALDEVWRSATFRR